MKTDNRGNNAAFQGLMLALITVVATTLQAFVTNSFLNTLIWLLKTVGSIWMLVIFMKEFAKANTGYSSFGYGFKVCFCSAIVCAVYSFILYAYICPDQIAEAFGQMYGMFGSKGIRIPDESRDMFLKIEDNYPQYACLSTFIGCLFWGLICSAIINSSVSRKDIFAEEEQEED